MSTLSACIKKAGKALNKSDSDEVKALRDELRADGLDAQQAAIEAAVSHIQSLLGEHGELTNDASYLPSMPVYMAHIEPAGQQKEEIQKPKEPVKAPTKSLESRPAAPISDFGEKIGGANKDTYSRLKDALSADVEIAAVPLEKSFPKPDYAKLASEGADKRALAFIAQLRAEIQLKPRKRWKLNGWVEAVESARNVAGKILSGDITIDKVLEGLSKTNGYSQNTPRILDLADQVPIEHLDLLGDYKLEKVFYSLYRGEKNVEKWEVTNIKKDSGFGGMSNKSQYHTADEAVKGIKQDVNFRGDGRESGEGKGSRGKTKLDVYRKRGEKGVWIGKKVGPRKFIDLKYIDDQKAAFEYLREHNDELLALLEKKKDIPSERREVNNARVGPDYRKGVDVTPELFGETFSFRGVEFGNWVEQKKRQDDLNQAFDALMDLAYLTGLPPRALSLNGELGMAFGARGKGGKHAGAAHYESGKVVINLTKQAGAGSLGHEWFHAVDNYFDRKRGRNEFATEYPSQRTNKDGTPDLSVRPEILEAFKGIISAIKASGMLGRSDLLDGMRTKSYWGTTRELTARAFERFLIDKAAESGNASDYLANIVDEVFWNASYSIESFIQGRDDSQPTYPYPTDAEAPAINAAYQNFVDTLQAVETEKGIAIESPGRDYGPVQQTIDLFAGIDPYENTETREGTTPQQLAVGRSALRALFDTLGRSARFGGSVPSLLGANIIRDFVQGKPAQLIGQTVRHSSDLAILAQVYRDPRFETFRVIYLDNNNTVLGETGVTSRLPASVHFGDGNTLISTISTRKKELGASSYYLLHNHPSGKSTPSSGDLSSTTLINASVPGMLSHVIIDHNEYSVIDRDGYSHNTDTHSLVNDDLHTNIEAEHPILGEEIGSAYDIANLASSLKQEDGYATLIITAGQYSKVHLIASVPMNAIAPDGYLNQDFDAWTHEKKLAGVLRRISRAAGAGGHRFLILPQNPNHTPRNLGWLMVKGLVKDVIVTEASGRIGAFSEVMGVSDMDAIKRNPKTIYFSKSAIVPRGATPKGVLVSEVEAYVQKFLERYPGADDGLQVRVHRTQDGAFGPDSRSAYGVVKGGFTPRSNTLDLVAEHLDGIADLEKTLRHEIIVHKGLGILSEQEQRELIDLIDREAPQSGSLRSELERIQKDYKGDSPRIQAEELLAAVAEPRYSYLDRLWTKIINWFREKLVKRGYIKPVISRRDLQEIVYDISKAFKEGRQARQRFEDQFRSVGQPEDGYVAPEFYSAQGQTLFSRERRQEGFPGAIGSVISTLPRPYVSADLKSHPDYAAAKSGDKQAALRYVQDMITPENIEEARSRFGKDVIFVAPTAMEMSGPNAIPDVMAGHYASSLGARVDSAITQVNRAYHTGANRLERMISRPLFDGPVEKGAKYVLVDDVITMGGTLAELADHIRAGGAEVLGVAVLSDASKTGKLSPSPEAVRRIDRRLGDEIRSLFRIEPSALTADEALSLQGIRDADQLRADAATAHKGREHRLFKAGISRPSIDAVNPFANNGESDPEKPRTLFSRKANEDGAQSKRKTKTEKLAERERQIEAQNNILASILAAEDEKGARTRKEKLREWVMDATASMYKPFLGVIPRQYLPDFAPDEVTAVERYVHDANIMDARRNELQGGHAELVTRWEQYAKKNPGGNRDLSDLMHQATIAGTDPASEYSPLISAEDAASEIKVQKERARMAPGSSKLGYFKNIQQIKNKLAQENRRAAASPRLMGKWNALDGEARQIYREARDAYGDQRALVFKALQERIERSVGDDGPKGNLMDVLRTELESQTVAAPYFPLQRFGDYWAAVFDDDMLQDYQMFESESDQLRYINQVENAGLRVNSGRHSKVSEDRGGVNAQFATKISGMLGEFSPDVAKDVQDQVWQVYLSMLPELSIRKNFIHRKKIPGFQGDALRNYAHNMFHGAHQLAKLEWRDRLEAHIQDARQQVQTVPDRRERNQATVLVDAVEEGHQWAMNPHASAAATALTSLGFAWYLGGSIASGTMNLTQTAIIGFPVLGAKYGFDKAAIQLARATKDVLANGIDSLRGGERLAFSEFLSSGIVDKTQSHDLAGIAEYGENYLSLRHKAMEIVAFIFHWTEKINREVTALAAYRLARAHRGSHDIAVDEAKDSVWMSHYNYSNGNRPAILRGDWPKVIFLFKQYSLNTTYRMARDLNDAIRAESPEVKREARRRFAGIQIMAGILGGIPALWMSYMVFKLVDALFDWDDDEPWDPEVELRAFLVDVIGTTGADAIMTGLVDALTPVSISDRISLSDLWWRDDAVQRDAYQDFESAMVEFLGPVPRIPYDFLKGLSKMADGDIMRGIEIASPTAIENVLKMGRFATEGVNSWRGDPVMDRKDIGLTDLIVQTAGFSPSSVAKQMDQNAALMEYQSFIRERKSQLLNRYFLALRMDDQKTLSSLETDIIGFNEANPSRAITPKTLRQSMKARFRATDRAQNGMMIDKGLEYLMDDLDYGE